MPKKSKLNLPSIDLGEPLGRRIARLRKERGYTQAELAATIGITQKLISDYELDKIRPYPEMVARFAVALHVTTDTLIGLQDSNTQEDGQPKLKLMRRLKKIEELPTAKQKVLLQNIDMFLKGVEAEK